MKILLLALVVFLLPASMRAGIVQRGKVQLMCHRTANRDLPENTLESLAYAARMGCNVIEVDVRMTLDGQLVLNHDGYLERLTDGMGDVSLSSLDELQMYDYGGWMGKRFSPMRIAKFSDALRLARATGVSLHLDIKEKGEGVAIYTALVNEGMTDRVIIGGEDGHGDDLRALMPKSRSDPTAWLGPDCTEEQIRAAHVLGKFVVANFSANVHEMDLPAMRAAVAAGVDAINVDYPRLGAEAVERPVEAKLAALAKEAASGATAQRTDAIRELSHYQGFPTQVVFTRLLHDQDAQVSRAAAVALVAARPAVPLKVFKEALSDGHSSTRQNAAWALGMLRAPAAKALLPLVKATDPAERKEALLAINKCPDVVPAEILLASLRDESPTVRAAAALALATHQPEAAAKAIPALLHREELRSAARYAEYKQRGMPKLTQEEIDPIIEDFREHMKLVHALELLPADASFSLLVREAFRSSEDFSHVTTDLAGYGLWDNIAVNASPAIAALDSLDPEVADRAEWMLVKASPRVIPPVRAAVLKARPAARRRLLYVLAWQGDAASLPLLDSLQRATPQDPDHDLVSWAIQTIHTLQLQP